ncbi:PREDICTED: testin-like [Amphimedon queenslandica]|uniref:LIM zinc-binding domain-containing protein n=1 Tax=Amphimedon queenslandica TaxID=400682 RepID=A0A1X7UI36_AMPQE|nr:PREDICTED: testin-like [Amphimedon queenslandica]|eukprot:XP_003387832.1 PREDICTED: testin-like [Amphimedon queenslandica]
MAEQKRVNRLPSIRSRAIETGVLVHEVDEGSPCLRCDNCEKGFLLHFWRKICANCQCPREEHDIRPHEERQAAVGKLLFHSNSDAKAMVKDAASKSPQRPRATIPHIPKQESESPSILRRTENFTWTPRDTTVEAARSFFANLPQNKKPVAGMAGDRYWQKQKIRQLPAHDIDLIYCNELTDEECKQMELFIKIRREKFLGRGMIKASDSSCVCKRCCVTFKKGESAVIADKLSGSDNMYHPACFTCTDCNELLIELIYFVYEDKLYCGRHHSEKMKPRCAACDEMIFCEEYTRAEDQNWHVNHFCCHRCDSYLGGQTYMAKETQPYCLKCYELLFANICTACGSTISLDEPVLKHEGKYWHARAECFKCRTCKKVLVDQPFLPKSSKIFCSKECFREYRDSKRAAQ